MAAVCMQQHGDGHAHILGASGNHNILPNGRNTLRTRIQIVSLGCLSSGIATVGQSESSPPFVTCAFNYFPDCPGSGREHGGLIQAHPTHIDYVEAVNILGRGNCIADRTLINVI